MQKRIVMIGSSCIDEYYEMEHVPGLGDKAVLKPLGSRIGGMIGNAAAVAAAYGMEVYLMDTINRGESTELILEDCRNAGIRTEMIRFDSSLPDVKCLIFLKDGERIVYVIPTEKKDIVPNEEEKRILREADYIYTSVDELKRFQNSLAFMEWVRRAGTEIVLDVEYVHEAGREEEWRIIQNADLVFVNQEGDEQLKRLIADDYEQVLTGCGSMVIKTKGAEGCEIYLPDGKRCRKYAYPVRPVDTTGAGDTFNASFVYGLSCGWTPDEAGEFANGAAARAILGMGARSGAAGEEKVREFIEQWRGEQSYE